MSTTQVGMWCFERKIETCDSLRIRNILQEPTTTGEDNQKTCIYFIFYLYLIRIRVNENRVNFRYSEEE
jgi:hypothetical protein